MSRARREGRTRAGTVGRDARGHRASVRALGRRRGRTHATSRGGPGARRGVIAKTLEMGFSRLVESRFPVRRADDGEGGGRDERAHAPRLFPRETLRPATAAFAESEMEEVMEAMVPRCSGRKECASCAATTAFQARGMEG